MYTKATPPDNATSARLREQHIHHGQRAQKPASRKITRAKVASDSIPDGFPMFQNEIPATILRQQLHAGQGMTPR